MRFAIKNGLILDDEGTQRWYLHGQNHREDDLPAIIYADGSQSWWRHNFLHRENGPAVILKNGSQTWFRHGKHMSVEKWIKDNNLPSWETWDETTWSLFRLEFL